MANQNDVLQAKIYEQQKMELKNKFLMLLANENNKRALCKQFINLIIERILLNKYISEEQKINISNIQNELNNYIDFSII